MVRPALLAVVLILLSSFTSQAAYHHNNETDSDLVLQVYPSIEGTKLDSCSLCHTGGEYEKKPGVVISMGSCQWCHYSYGYDASGNIDETLNPYGAAYQAMGNSADDLLAIEDQDSDADGYSNIDEIAALRFPGNDKDDPTRIAAPYKIVGLDELEQLEYHEQLMLMNTHKSGDFYARYGGVTMAALLEYSAMLESATGISVYAPDGWAQYHPLENDVDPLMYPVYGIYPQADYYYDLEADEAKNDNYGWCDYSFPGAEDLEPHIKIEVENGLRLLLAYKRNGNYLDSGKLADNNKLDGEGPFRVVPPQKLVGPPDQSVKSNYQDVIWPFNESNDHNAGFATRSATIIRVEPLPEGFTDIDTLEAGWNYVDDKKIVIYGAIDPYETILGKLEQLQQTIQAMDPADFKRQPMKYNTIKRLDHIAKAVRKGHDESAAAQLESLARKIDGCMTGDSADYNDWLTDCQSQLSAYWSLYEIEALMGL